MKGENPGRRAEDTAARFLAEAGYRILDRNKRGGRGELDIVAEDNGTLVFVEVRSRARGGLTRPEETVDRAKRNRLVSAAEAYLAGRKEPLMPCRFDVVAISFGDGPTRVRHLVDAFRPGD